MNSEDFQQILESMGYRLIDCGDHWRTQALYRSGDNQTAVKIYKNTGVWMDFVINKGSKPFEALVRETLKGDDGNLTKLLSKVKNADAPITYKKKDTIEMEKIYPPDALDKLFPNYSFYKKRLISEETQKKFQVGLAGVGKMYRRMVFPIYNEHNQIIGFSGRKVDDNNNYPKWKHIGKRNNWVYPALNCITGVKEEIALKKEVILVESIGDALALYEQNIKNVLVIFGLSVNNNIVSYLSGMPINRITISTNNDEGNSDNRGFIAGIKNYLKLSSYFDLNILSVKFPPKPYNDFGDAHLEGCDFKSWIDKKIDQADQLNYICGFIKKNKSCFTKKEIKTSLVINNE
jgi:hypothetical protein